MPVSGTAMNSAEALYDFNADPAAQKAADNCLAARRQQQH
jgi:hypothetical protein